MTRARRPRIPQPISDEVLFASDHTCCVCRARNKDVQIHHIDRSRTNNDFGNLAVLCLDCHSKVTGSRGLGQSYSRGEVRRFKRAWERSVQESRGVHRPRIAHKKELFSQVDLIVCEILSLRSDSRRVRELLGVLNELHLWRGSPELDRVIVGGLSHLALMSGLSSPRVAALVAEKLWELCWHFVGPHEVPMQSSDEQQVATCIDALETLATFNSQFGHGRKAVGAIAKSAENFFDVGIWYTRPRLTNAVLRLFEKSVAACAPDSRVEFRHGYLTLRRSLRKLRAQLTGESPRWRSQRGRIDRILGRSSSNKRIHPPARRARRG
jgi:hypothetical protein